MVELKWQSPICLPQFSPQVMCFRQGIYLWYTYLTKNDVNLEVKLRNKCLK